MAETEKPTLTAGDLERFTGSETWFRHGLNRNVSYTEGAKFLADRAGAHWLLDEIALAQINPKIRGEEFQVWKLAVKDSAGKLTCTDGNGGAVYSKRITFTDFPLPEVTVWFENNVIYLPSEH